MVTVHREGRMRVMIFGDDHEPAHVQVFGDCTVNINLLGADRKPELVSADGMTRGDIRKAVRIVSERQDYLLMRWRDIHG